MAIDSWFTYLKMVEWWIFPVRYVNLPDGKLHLVYAWDQHGSSFPYHQPELGDTKPYQKTLRQI